MAAFAAAATLTGCGISDPYNDPATAKPAQQTASADEHDEHKEDEGIKNTRRPESVVSQLPPGNAGAEQVAAAYGLAQMNWSHKTYPDQYRKMVALAGGQLRRDLKLSPPAPEQLEGIKRDKQVNEAQLVATDSTKTGDSRVRVVVVLKETAGAKGYLDPTSRHTVHQAIVAQQRGAWRVLEWELLA